MYLPAGIRKRLDERQSVKKILANVMWLSFDKLFRMGAGLLVGVWVVRYLGPKQFGVFSYAIAFYALFGSIASLGLDGIVIRELVKNPSDRNNILGTAFLLKLAGSLVAVIMSVVAIYMYRNNDLTTTYLVFIVATGSIFQSFDVIDFWFQSQVLARHTVIAKNSAFMIVQAFKIYLIMTKAPIQMFAWATFAEAFLGASGLIIAYKYLGFKVKDWCGSLNRARYLLKDSWPMIISSLSVAIYMKIDQVMLGDIAGNEAVGLYTSATKLSEIWYMIPIIIVSSLFPAVVQSKSKDEELYYRRITRLFSLMAAMSLPIAIPISFCSNWIVTILYGAGYQDAALILSVHIWSSIFVFYGVAQNSWDISENLAKLAMVRIITGAIVNILLNIFLIPKFGAVGAAYSTVISQALAAVFLNLLNHKTRPIFFCQLRSLLFWQYLRRL